MKRLALGAALALLLAPCAAEAKGTNVRISSAPNGTDAGETWRTAITVTMPGNGPLGRLRPALVIRRGAETDRFAARPTGRRGVYSVRVVFPARGRWHYGVEDGFDRYERGAGRMHAFPPVTIGPGERPLDRAPLPVSGEVEPPPAAAPPIRATPAPVTAPSSGDDDGGGASALVVVPAFLLALLALGGIALRRRRRIA